LAVGKEPCPQVRVFDALNENPHAFRHGRTTSARHARLWGVLTLHGLVERSTALGQATAFFTCKLRERLRTTTSAIGGSRSTIGGSRSAISGSRSAIDVVFLR
jgi:hypothetical protein